MTGYYPFINIIVHVEMSIPRSEILQLCGILAQNRQLRVTVSNSVQGAVATGIGALLGGLLGGPRGLAIGGATAAICAGVVGAGKYKSVIDVIREDMTEEQRKQLADACWTVIKRVNPHHVMDATTLLALVSRDTIVEGQVVEVMQNFFSSLDMSLV